MNKKDLIILFFVILLGLGSSWFFLQKKTSPNSQATRSFGGDFTLQAQNGPWKLSSTNGKVRILYFGFTSCPDVCPLAMNKLTQALDKIAPTLRKNLKTVFISVDWKRDTPKSVQEYVEFFAPDFTGLTGSQKEIEKVTKQYGVFYQFVPLKDSALGYTVDHSSRYYIVDKKGDYVTNYTQIKNNPKFIEKLTELLEQ